MNRPKGTLVAVGGNDDARDDLVVLRRILGDVKGGAKNAIVVAAASRDPVATSRPYLRAFEDLGIDRVRPLDLQSRREAEERRTEERLMDADVVYFTGGDPVRLAGTLRGSKALDILRQRYAEGAVVAGTGAGAVALGHAMLPHGRAEEGRDAGDADASKGLGLLPASIIDTHFVQRGRFSRLIDAVTQAPALVGLGIGEDTAFVVREGRHVEVVGSGNVIVIDGAELRHANRERAGPADAIAVERVILHALAEGYGFDLEAREFRAPKAKQAVSA